MKQPARALLPLLTLAPLAPALGGSDEDALRRALLADASRRETHAGTAGHDGRFFLASADGGFRLNCGVQFQTRYALTFRDAEGPEKDLANGFQVNRAKLHLTGQALDGAVRFNMLLPFSSSTGVMGLENAFFDHDLGEGFTLRWGQFKPPFMREELVSALHQLAVDRSVANEVYNQDWAQGVQLGWSGERVRLAGAFTDGFGTTNTAHFDPAEADAALTARAEYRFGEAPWSAYADMTSPRGAPRGGLLGAAIHWESAGDTASTATFGGVPAPEREVLGATVDASVEGGGWSAMGAMVFRSIDTPAGPRFDDWGLTAQGAIYFTERDEVFARWDAVLPDGDRAAGDDFHTLTAGVNHYFHPGSHAAKLSADVQVFLGNATESADLVRPSPGYGLLPGEEDGQVAVRVQMQLLF